MSSWLIIFLGCTQAFNNTIRQYRHLNFFPSNIYLLLHMYPLFVLLYKRTFQKYIACAIVITAQVFPRSRENAAPSQRQYSFRHIPPPILPQQPCTHAVCFNLCNNAHLVTSSFVPWKMAAPYFALTAFSRFSGCFSRHFCMVFTL